MGLTNLYIPAGKTEFLPSAILKAGMRCVEFKESLGNENETFQTKVFLCGEGGTQNVLYVMPQEEAMGMELKYAKENGVAETDFILRITMRVGFLGLFRLRKIREAQHRLIDVLVTNGAKYLGSNHLPAKKENGRLH